PLTDFPSSQWLLLALAAWCVHNLIDIDLYFPSMGAIGAVLIGVLLKHMWGDRSSFSPQSQPAMGVLSGFLAAFGVAAIVFSGLSMVSEELRHRAQVEYQDHKPAQAVATLNQAKAFMPLNSSVYHDAGDILLDIHTKSRDPQSLADATDSFR